MKKINTENIDNFIFDMDGTLYRLDGPGGLFHGSSLHSHVEKNSLSFVKDKEDSNEKLAFSLIEEARQNKVGASVYFSEKYKISRNDFFDIVWNIDPEGVLKEYKEAVETINKLKLKNKNLILLTAAPRVWKNKVLKFLQIDDHFSEEFSGDMFSEKTEVFEMFSKRFDVSRTISIGDQLHTDIKPAKIFGMKTLLVKHPKEVKKLWKK